MSDLDNAINSINASAAKAENTATFLDDMSTFDDQSSVTNPNNGQTVASIPKQVKDRTDELFTAAESDINQAVADAEQSATDAQDAADSIGRYQGLWPDSGGIADKGDTYQTQINGTPTGQYFTALQNTTADPVGDDVNWRAVVSNQSLGGLASYQAASVADAIAGVTVNGVVDLEVGQRWIVDDYYGGATPNNSGVLFFKVVEAGAGVSDGGKYIDIDANKQLEQNISEPKNPKAWGAYGDDSHDDADAFKATYALGGHISIPAGSYRLSETINVPSGTKTTGQGHVNLKMITANTTMFKSEGAVFVEYRDLILTGFGASDTASTLNRDNNTANAQAIGIWFDSGSEFTVETCTFRYFKNNAIRSAYSSQVHIRNNNINGTYPDADIPFSDTGRQQFGIIVYAESAAEKGANMSEVLVDKTASRHGNKNIYIDGNTITQTAIGTCIYPGYENVSVTNNKTYGTLSQHSAYAYGSKKCLIANNQFGATQNAGIKISCNVLAYCDIPREIDVINNEISNTAAPSISFEIFDKYNDGTYSVAKASVCFERCNISGNNISLGQDTAIVTAVMRNSTIQNNTIYDMNPSSSREMINLRTFAGRINDNVLKADDYSGLGGAGMLGASNSFYFENNVMENLCKAAAGYYATLGKPVEPFYFSTNRYINWYGAGGVIINDVTKEVYQVVQGGVAGDTAPTGTDDVVSGECTFRYLGLYDDITTDVFIKKNIFRVGDGTQATGCISFNHPDFNFYVANNYADPSITQAQMYGTFYEYEGNNTNNLSEGASPLAPMCKGNGGNNYQSASLPVTGTYEKGDIIWHPDPVSIGYVGWVCTNKNPVGSGSTWVNFGAIV